MKKIFSVIGAIFDFSLPFGCGLLLVLVYMVYALGVFIFKIFSMSSRDFHIFIAFVVVAIVLINIKTIFSYFLRLWDKAGTFFLGITLFGLLCVIGSWVDIINKGMNNESILALAFGLVLVGSAALNQ